MAAYQDKCRACGREFKNYDDLTAWRRCCSVACQVEEAAENARADAKERDIENLVLRQMLRGPVRWEENE